MASFAHTQTALVVDRVPYFKSGTITSGATTTIAFDNLTDGFQVWCTSGSGALVIGVSTAGLSGDAYISLAANNTTFMINAKVKQLVLNASGADMGYQVLAILNREQAASYPDLTTANGFSGV